jgi:hypothetical protein
MRSVARCLRQSSAAQRPADDMVNDYQAGMLERVSQLGA